MSVIRVAPLRTLEAHVAPSRNQVDNKVGYFVAYLSVIQETTQIGCHGVH